MLTKLTKIKWKERIFKVAKEKSQVTYKGNPICLTDDLSTESLQPRRKWQDTFKVLKGKNLQPRLLYLARISFKIDGKSKGFSGKQKLRELNTIKQPLQQVLKSPTVFVLLSITPFMSVSVCLMYWGTPMLGAYTFTIVIFSPWIDPLIIV